MQVARCFRQLPERLLDRGQLVPTRFGKHQRVPLAVEQLDSEALFERLDLVAHRCRSDEKFLGRPRKIEVLCPKVRSGLRGGNCRGIRGRPSVATIQQAHILPQGAKRVSEQYSGRDHGTFPGDDAGAALKRE
jgi:hypothetical protein